MGIASIPAMDLIQEQTPANVGTNERRASTEEGNLACISRFLRSEHGGFHCLMAGIAIALSLTLAALFRLESISVINLHLLRFALQCGVPIMAVASYCHWAGYGKLRDGSLLVSWSALFVNLLLLPSYAAARTGFPFQDALLARADGLMRINVGSVAAWVHLHPTFERLSIWSYSLMPGMVFAAIFIPAMGGYLRRAKEFLLATIVAALLASCVLAVSPAIGPWAGFHFTPYSNQAWYVRELQTLRAPRLFTANPDYTCGLITFPSFHVALAALGLFALWPFRWLRPIALAVAVLIAIATVTTGWHYASDGIAGILVAALGIVSAKVLLRLA